MTDENKRLCQDCRNIFEAADGERVLKHLRKVFQYDKSVIPRGLDGHIDANEVMRNEGQRSVIRHILLKMSTDPEEEKQKEAVHEKQE